MGGEILSREGAMEVARGGVANVFSLKRG